MSIEIRTIINYIEFILEASLGKTYDICQKYTN